MQKYYLLLMWIQKDFTIYILIHFRMEQITFIGREESMIAAAADILLEILAM